METLIHRRDDLTVQDLGAEMILFDERSGTFHVLNDAARKIWHLLDGTRGSVSLSEQYANLYPQEDKHRLESDLQRALEEFGRRGLLASSVESRIMEG